MKIYFLQDYLRGGGTERQSIELTKGLIENGFSAHLLVGLKGGALDDLAREELGEHLSFISKKRFMFYLETMTRLRRLSKGEPLVLVCMGRWAHSMIGLLPKKNNLRIISTLRTNRKIPFLYCCGIKKSSHLIANSYWAADYAAKCIPPACLPRRTVIHNALSRPELLEITQSERAEVRRAKNISTKQLVLLSVARLEAEKGHKDLLLAVSKLRRSDFELWLIGEGPERKSLQELATKLGVSDRVHFLGFKEDIRPYFACADLFICASSLDSLPNALIEAQAAGIPIISYRTAGIPEIVVDQATGIICQHSCPDELSNQIAKILDQEDERMRMGLAARERIREIFSRQQVNKSFSELISEYCKDR